MKHKGFIGKIISCFVIVFLLSNMANGIVSASTMRPSLFVTQTYADEEIQTPSTADGSPDILQMIQAVNTSHLQGYLEKIQAFGPHPTGSAPCDALATYLYRTLSSFHLTVQYDLWRYKLRSGKNIEATLPGKNHNGIVLVTAHYDSVTVSPGANDDGSGVAVVLAVADIMSHYQFNSTVKFVLFSGEEQGLLGSHEYVQQASRQGEHIIGDLNLDGVGYAATTDDGSTIKHHSNNQSAWMVDMSTRIATTYADEIGLTVVRLPHVTFSDQDSFVKNGYDASYFYEYVLSPYYHTNEDTVEHMNMTYLTKICRLTVGTLALMAEVHPRLSNTDLKISITGSIRSGPSQFRVKIENKKPKVDTANVTIHITIKNLRTGQFVRMTKDNNNVSCNWTFTEEIRKQWVFESMPRKYSPQFIALEVTIRGTKDDVTLYKTQRTTGVIIGWSLFLFPSL
jgi:aminopeptidase YwaD